MCGIAGHLRFDNLKIDPAIIQKMTDTLTHRGPDDCGIFCEDNITLGHRRLSIIDLSPAGHQPMFSENGRYVIVFNGEIYNFQEIKSKLLQSNHKFLSHSDTEVILESFIEWGEESFSMFNGMFAFAIWDILKKELFIARDRFGIKPLYYLASHQGLYFASEMKAILAALDGTMHINKQSLIEYMWYGNALGENTIYADIKKLLPGHYIKSTDGKIILGSYWSLNQITQNKAIERDDGNEIIKRTKNLLENAVKSNLVSDVPVGIFLSGGIDSSAITAFASKHSSEKIQTYSVGFDFAKGVNELDKARSVADRFGTDHNELHVSADNIPSLIEKLIDHHDEPFGDAANIPLYLLSLEIKGKIKVVLQGDGGDEIFGGYSRYKTLQDIKKWKLIGGPLNIFSHNFSKHPKWQQLKRFTSAILQKEDYKRMALLLTVETETNNPLRVLNASMRESIALLSPFKRYQDIDEQYADLDIVQRMFYTDCSIILPDTFLEKVDKSTMANSLEVRVPFLDNALTEYVLGLPSKMKVKNGEQKYLLKAALRGVVPDNILDAPKTGFGVPYGYWLQTKLSNYLKEVLLSDDFIINQVFDKNVMKKIINEHISGKGYHSFLLWKCLNLGIWLNKNKNNISLQ
ncbi:MAG: asparagine synthase (glutamine-hydrolyzing) [Bacteroidota bacterium]|nr:asparagine synthase (glutamine-hydrolyzing) [Bacteroidota bacterium]